VREALAAGALDRERYANWSKLRGEARGARDAIRDRGRGGAGRRGR